MKSSYIFIVIYIFLHGTACQERNDHSADQELVTISNIVILLSKNTEIVDTISTIDYLQHWIFDKTKNEFIPKGKMKTSLVMNDNNFSVENLLKAATLLDDTDDKNQYYLPVQLLLQGKNGNSSILRGENYTELYSNGGKAISAALEFTFETIKEKEQIKLDVNKDRVSTIEFMNSPYSAQFNQRVKVYSKQDFRVKTFNKKYL